MRTELHLQADRIFANRMQDVPRSFIREILKVASSPGIISFAGGLPNPALFPVDALEKASYSVLRESPGEALQYSNSEGYLPLRRYIADRYAEKQGLQVRAENILITSGSQQALDLLAKVFLNKGDQVFIEEPGYLGAIQAFSVFQARMTAIPLTASGMDVTILQQQLLTHDPRLIYVVPDFQNPSGISYSEKTRRELSGLITQRKTILVEDTPYTEIRFRGNPLPSFYSLLPEQTVMLGSFSKTAVPGFRLGWMVAPDDIMEKLIIVKQAADLHTSTFIQRVLHEYLIQNDSDEHIRRISRAYGSQCAAMLNALQEYFPDEAAYTRPEGGMFLWVTLPDRIAALDLFDKALKREVAFVPGDPFYVGLQGRASSLRLNYSCADEETIFEGIRRLSGALKELRK